MNLIYKKSLRLTTISRKASSVGEITNLMSVNTQNIVDLCLFLNIIWSAPFQIIVTLIYLWQYLGMGAIAGFFTMLLFIPLNIFIANKTKEVQVNKLKVQDKRIKMTNEILNGIKVIKLYGWELSFIDIISKIRNFEMKHYKKKSILGIFGMFTWFMVPFLVSFVSFATFVLISDKNKLDTETAFVSISLFNILRFPLAMLPGVISSMIEASVAIKRITNFLLNDEINHDDITYNDYEQTSVNTAIKVENSYLGWSNEEISITIPQLNVDKKQLIAIVGPVGSGKSSILAGLLGEMCKINPDGKIFINGETAFVPQQAWIQNATVRDNILFGRDYNESAYNEIIKACSLVKDFEIMAAGDKTEIGEKGINLSGGQKQRISLARSVYANADIYILDDPLSAVDAHVGKSIFDNVIGSKGMLREKTRLFVTNNLSFLPQVDRILMMENGEIVESGTYKELIKNPNGSFSVFIKKYIESNETNKDNIKKNVSDSKLLKTQLSKEETQKKGDVDACELPETSNDETKRKQKEAGEKIIVKENIVSGSVKFSIVLKFFQVCSIFLSISGLIFSVLSSTAQVGANIWLSDWSDEMNKKSTESIEPSSNMFRLGVYALIGFVQSFFFVFSEIFFMYAFIRGAKEFHNSMLYNVLRSTLEFFESTPIGRILNRFSKDIDSSENAIPMSFKMLLRCLLVVCSTIIVISVSTPLFLIALIPIIIIYILVQRYFVATMRQLKRIEATTRSPIYSQFSETLTGISTIRAFRAENRFIRSFESLIDNNLIYYYPTDFCNRWLAVHLEALGNLITVFAALFAVLARDSISAGIAAMSITYSLNITQTLNWLVRMSAEFEANITSIERIQEYCDDIPAEKEWQTEDPSENWPSSGRIQFVDWSVKYRKELDYVLKCIRIDIQSGEKIGIVGRTGAGKSSLTLGLFRILENSTGSIFIDNIDISTIGLHNLRHKIAIIPQDPVIFSGKIRTNLDPFDKFSDQQLWSALEHAHLKEFVNGLDGKLDFECSEGGENLSVGQRQLICLARALLRKTKILVLDEATASVDHNTDDLIQKTIREEFADCTVLTIAHRLNTIMDSTRVMVLDKGRVIEFDTPTRLLKNKNSHFYSMAEHAGLV